MTTICSYREIFHDPLIWPFVNILRPRQNGRHFPDDILKCIFLNENLWISTKISLKFVLKGPIINSPALVQIMAWRRPGDKPLSEPMMVSLLTHICVTRPQWVNRPLRQRWFDGFSLPHLLSYLSTTLLHWSISTLSTITCHIKIFHHIIDRKKVSTSCLTNSNMFLNFIWKKNKVIWLR